MSRGRKRPPTEEELQLWQKVTDSVAPLEKAAPGPKPPVAKRLAKSKEKPAAKASPAPPALPAKTSPRPRPPQPPALNPLDRRARSRVARGAVAIDRRVDLHGLTQDAAHRRLNGFLQDAQADGAKLVLVITGKGKPIGDFRGEERGVLRRVVPVWLSAADMRPIVIGFDEASPSHGGAGALYVRIRRPKPRAG